MRLSFSLLIPLLAAAPPSAAQVPSVHHGWHLGGGVDVLRFGHVAVSDAAPGIAAEVRPSGRAALHVAAGRAAGPWDISLELGWAEGTVEVGNEVVSVRDLTSDVSRYRLSLAAARQFGRLGAGTLGFALAPTVDLWTVTGDSRLRVGGEARLLLRVPLGAVDLEHRLGLGFSGSPIEAADLGQAADERGLRTVLIGLGLRTRL